MRFDLRALCSVLLFVLSTGFMFRTEICSKPSAHVIASTKSRLSTSLNLSVIEFIPALLGTTAIVFAAFNIDNKVDLTDAGRAAARSKKRAEMRARGEVSKSTKNLDPYRWGADDDDDIDILTPRSGGGCG
mmetsp:Transcript_17862/g.17937  ORF Transcript_17862/g.17937 Transcript_17862/m.17937 type:complete len:131 (-) Transcript_17862:95-487(-)